jgi:hypothetical protein
MKLGKLLGAGKSFFGGGGAVKYRADKHVYLPKFNAEKNPFTPQAAEAKSELAKTQKLPEISAKTQKIAVPPVAFKPAPGPTRAVSWKDKLNPFRAPEPAAPSMVGAVQSELSLDAVKVIRNDLADADIEVVPVKSQTVSAPETPVLPPPRHSWEFLGERLVRVD